MSLICYICDQEIDKNEEPWYTEDGKPVHKDCYLEFERFWDDREDFFNLMDENDENE